MNKIKDTQVNLWVSKEDFINVIGRNPKDINEFKEFVERVEEEMESNVGWEHIKEMMDYE